MAKVHERWKSVLYTHEIEKLKVAPDWIKEAISKDTFFAVNTLRNWIDSQVWCPYCNRLHDTEDTETLVTFWGSEEDIVVSCNYCEAEFYVQEHVARTYESKALDEE